jgi:hypothetical protein
LVQHRSGTRLSIGLRRISDGVRDYAVAIVRERYPDSPAPIFPCNPDQPVRSGLIVVPRRSIK